MKNFRISAIVAIAALCACGAVGGSQASKQVEACADKSIAPDAAMKACNALIDAGQLDDANLELTYFNRAQLHDQLGHYDRAIEDFSQVVRIQPKNAMAFGYRGAIHGKKGELDAALADIDQALVLNPRDGEGHMNRGTALEAKGEYVEAIASYDRALELMPQNVIALGGRCWTRAVAKIELDAALADCDKAIALDTSDANLHNSRGFANYRLGRYEVAINDYTAAIDGNPSVASSYYMRGFAKHALGDDVSANADITKGKAIDPNVVARYARFGVIH